MKKKFFLTTFMLILCAIGTLTACKKIYKHSHIESHIHSYIETITNPTCTEQGFSTYTCSCGDSYICNYVNTLEHTYDQEIISDTYLKTAATCTTLAVNWKSCVCGLVSTTETFEYGTTLPHNFGTYSKTQNATCTANAKETAYCEDCGEFDVRDIDGTALGHGDINTNNICSVCNKEVAYTKGMVYVAISGGYQLIDMGSATDADIIIPKYYNGSPVISIASEVFKNKTTLTSISLPDTITSIGNYAFYGCSKIKELILPKSVKSIGYLALARCVSLEYLTIPCLQVELSFSSSYMLDQPLTELFMESMPKMSYIPSDATYVYSEARTSSTIYYYYWYKPENLKKITVLDTVENIPENAFYCFDMVEEIELPNTIKTIDNHAFRYCSSLKSVNIPDSVTSIGNSAFGSCYNLREVKLGTGLIEIDAFAFQSCTSLTEITISSSVNSIGIHAFSGCTQLNKIIFKNTSGWKVDGKAIDVSNSYTNAVLFKKTYVSSRWSR